MNKLLFVAALIVTSVCAPAATSLNSGWTLQDAVGVSQPGQVISQTSFVPRGWLGATVPGTVLTSLVDDGIYPEPLYGENNRPDKIPDTLCRTSYWYRRQFVVPPDFAGKHIWLQFSGINYTAEIWVNGKNFGTLRGAFARGMFDITSAVEPGRVAGLAVHIGPPPHPGVPNEHTLVHGVGSNGGILTEDGPTFLCTQGWNWMPGIRDRDMGIWQNVTLSATGPLVIQDPVVNSVLPLPRTDSADLTVQITVRNASDQPQKGVVHGTLDHGGFELPVILQAGESRLFTTSALQVDHPRLWWPNGYGQPNLNSLHLRLDVNGTVSDAREVTFGIRSITYQLPGSQNLALSVNGVPIFCKGGNWGMDEAMKRISRPRLEAQIRMHQQAHFNMIRNWVGQSTSEDFYDLCDRYGLLVWDEFFQPNPSDGPDPLDADLYLANVKEKVLRFRNHPSIALWCARNEGNPPPLIDAGIRGIMTALDPQRLYQANSSAGRGVRSGGPYSWRPPRQYYVFPAGEAFKTELGGGVSMPTLESVQAMLPEKDWNTINDDWAEHNFCHGTQGGDKYAALLTARYGAWTDLAGMVREGQMANYEAFRAMYEGRQVKMFKPCTGVLDWMSNPAQPSFTYQLYSHDLEPNASLFAAEKACEPIHIQMNQSDFHVTIINNTAGPLEELRAAARVFDLDGRLKSRRVWTLNAQAAGTSDAGALDVPEGVFLVKLELRDRQGQLLSDNFYWQGDKNHPDDLTALQRMAEIKIQARVSRRDQGGKCLLEVNLSNPSPRVAMMVHLQLRGRESDQRVLPVYYSDNYLCLLGAESRGVSIEAATGDLAGQTPAVVVDGWNVAKMELTP